MLLESWPPPPPLHPEVPAASQGPSGHPAGFTKLSQGTRQHSIWPPSSTAAGGPLHIAPHPIPAPGPACSPWGTGPRWGPAWHQLMSVTSPGSLPLETEPLDCRTDTSKPWPLPSEPVNSNHPAHTCALWKPVYTLQEVQQGEECLHRKHTLCIYPRLATAHPAQRSSPEHCRSYLVHLPLYLLPTFTLGKVEK